MRSQFNRTAVYVSLGLAVALVCAVILGSKFYYASLPKTPVAIASLPSPEASSAECAKVIDAAPERFMGHPRAPIAEPVPPGVAAWASDSVNSVTLRCGVDMPYQYTKYSQLTEVDGTQWLRVTDMTPGSTLTTWYTANRAPVVAVTTFDDSLPKGLDAVQELALHDQERQPAPLADLRAVAADCTALSDALPLTLASDYELQPDADAFVWTAPGREAIVARCGVEPPPGYKAGVQLQQINDIPWFEDTTLASGTTASTWFALGRETDIALHIPQDVAQEVLVDMSNVIAKHTKPAS